MKRFLFALIILFPGCSSYSGIQEDLRPLEWGQPVVSNNLENVHQVSSGLYRGAQPDRAGMLDLKEMGIKSVLNLRSYHSNEEILNDLPVTSFRIRTHAGKITDAEVLSFLKIILDPNNQPVFVHCRYGADRTGLMCAVYRVVIQGWSRDSAIHEMQRGGYGAHKIYNGLARYIREMDVTRIRNESGWKGTPVLSE